MHCLEHWAKQYHSNIYVLYLVLVSALSLREHFLPKAVFPAIPLSKETKSIGCRISCLLPQFLISGSPSACPVLASSDPSSRMLCSLTCTASSSFSWTSRFTGKKKSRKVAFSAVSGQRPSLLVSSWRAAQSRTCSNRHQGAQPGPRGLGSLNAVQGSLHCFVCAPQGLYQPTDPTAHSNSRSEQSPLVQLCKCHLQTAPHTRPTGATEPSKRHLMALLGLDTPLWDC